MVQQMRLDDAFARLKLPGQYHPCCLVIHPQPARLQQALDGITQRYGWPHVSLGTVVANTLAVLPMQRRSAVVGPTVVQACTATVPGPVICCDVDLLFEPSLNVDPLRLLFDTSRSVPLVVLWPGRYTDGVLAYAVPEHTHYRTWRPPLAPELLVPLT